MAGHIPQIRTTRAGEPDQLRKHLEEPPKRRTSPWFWLLTCALVLIAFAGVYLRNDLVNALKPKPDAPEALSASQVQVIDGGTIRLRGRPNEIRLIGFKAPETVRASCDAEREHGYTAMRRLRAIVESAELQFQSVACACPPGAEGTETCNSGRRCGILRANGWDVGERLIAEGLALRFTCSIASCPAPPKPWCDAPARG